MKIYFTSKATGTGSFAELALRKYDGSRGVLSHREDGSPFFCGSDINVSISHSKGVTVVAISEEKLGIDVEKIAPRDWKKISDRYFPEEEKEKLAEGDIEAFYDIWTAKEAWTKYLRKGLSSTLGKTPEGVVITKIPLLEGYSCSICTEGEAEYEIEEI